MASALNNMGKSLCIFFFPPNESWKESLPAFLSVAGLLLFLGFVGFSKAMLNMGAALICAGLVVQIIVQGPKSFLILNSRFLGAISLLAFGWLAFRSFGGIDSSVGTALLRGAIYKGLTIFIAGMQLVRHPRYIKILIAAIALAAFIQGLNGIWQYCTGFDFIRNSPQLGGRLTSAFATYRVGDLMAMFLVPMLCLPWVLPKSWPAPLKTAAAALLMIPPVFLLIFADSRSGFNFMFVSIVALLLIRYGLKLRIILPALCIVVLVVLSGFNRFSPEEIMADGRVREIWPFAWSVFKAHPIIGAGIGGFTAAYAELGLTAQMHPDGIAHPHNIYLQFLAEMGIIGFGIWVTFFGSIIYKGWKTLRAHASNGMKTLNLPFVFLCWAGCCGCMAMGGSAHSFLRDWWFGLNMFYFGVTAGVIALEHFNIENV